MIVMKFGGSSLESAAAIARVAQIVTDRLAQRPVVVVSAIGKTTQQLLNAAAEAASRQKEQAVARLRDLRQMHEREVGGTLAARYILEAHFLELGELLERLTAGAEMTPEMVDAISSYGERLSSQLIALVFQELHCPRCTLMRAASL